MKILMDFQNELGVRIKHASQDAKKTNVNSTNMLHGEVARRLHPSQGSDHVWLCGERWLKCLGQQCQAVQLCGC